MKSQELEIPQKPVMMQTNRDYRMASLSGWVINFHANTPARVPPTCYEEALAIGAVRVEDEPEPVMVDATIERPHANIHESVAEAARMEEAAKVERIEGAIVHLWSLGDNTKFKADGYPKYQSIIEVLPKNTPKPLASDIQEVFDNMREDVKYAELMGT